MPDVFPGHRDHPRLFQGRRFVYPVVARRSGGISVGINLCPDQACNFDCAYCQVDRRREGRESVALDPAILLSELEETLRSIETGALFQEPRFLGLPSDLQVLNDVAFSGDGEPTAAPLFPRVLGDVLQLRREWALGQIPIVVFTNGSLLDREAVRRSLEALHREGGQLWAKLDAGTEAQFHRLNRSPVRFGQILSNLSATARWFPLTVQSMFVDWEGQPPADSEIDAYLGRLRDLLDNGGSVRLVQVYTVARPPADPRVSAVSEPILQQIADRIVRELGVPAEAFGG
jgi:wyosine [tRNA(Phe)-imidazoG37] synthetase (radical SAM superfamily)